MSHKEKGVGLVKLCLRVFLCLVLFLGIAGRMGEVETVFKEVWASGNTVPDTKPVRVGYVEAPCFMQGMSDDAAKSGMAYDYLQRVSYYTNWSYTYVYGDWATILDKLCKGEVDVMAGVSKTPERFGKMLFPDYAMGSENYYIYVHADHPLAGSGLEGLAGHTVSVNANTIMYDLLQRWNEEGRYQLNILTYSGNAKRYKDFKAQRAEATVDTDNAVQDDENLIPLAQIGQSDYYLAINKERPDLLQDLNAALRKISATNPRFTDMLASAYFSKLAVVANLPADELAWLSAHPVITVGYIDDYLPLSDCDDEGQINGILKDILQEIALKLNIQDKVRFQGVPYNSYEELIHALANGSVDVAFPINNDVQQAERDGLFLSSEVITTPMHLIYMGDFSALNLRRIGVKRENSIGDTYVKAYYPEAEIVYYDNVEEMLTAVKRGEADGCILNQFRKDAYLLHAGYRELQTIPLKHYISRGFAVRHGNSELLSILNRGISRLPADFSLTSTYAYTGRMAPMTFKDYLVEHLLAVWLVAGIIIAILSVLLAYIFFIRHNKKKIQYIAHHDNLTGLLNRNSFNIFLSAHSKGYPRDDLVVLSMDLNGLKAANDNLGHEAGDELLIGAAGCMKQVLSPYGSVYRTGGDEFVAIIEAVPESLPSIVQALKVAFGHWQGDKNKVLSVSLGIAHNGETQKLSLSELIALADHEMYRDKAAYYNRQGADRRRQQQQE